MDRPPIPENLKNIDEIHDWITKELKKKGFENQEIKYDEYYQPMDGVILGDLRIELPKDTWTVMEYGEKLKHCIAGYARNAVNKQCVLMAIYKGGELKYNLEIRNEQIRQFRGKCNCDPEAADRVIVMEFLEGKWKEERAKKGIMVEATYGMRNVLDNFDHEYPAVFV